MGRLMSLLNKWRQSAFVHHFSTPWIAEQARKHAATIKGRPVRILDIGLGWARDMLAIRAACAGMELELYGIESQPYCVENAKKEGIDAFPLDIERESIPMDDEFFDIVTSNHVIEHTKELFWIFSEISRVLARGGVAMIGCPNLGSWHNRAALLLGQQPPGMKTLGPHVRGITKPAFKQFIECESFFKLEAYRGSNFYPFPGGKLNYAFSAMLPTLCASHHFMIRRTTKPGTFIEVLDSGVAGITDTPYHRGPVMAEV